MNTHHVVSRKTYFRVFATLLALLVLTVAISSIPGLGIVSVALALTIAITKAVLIILYFMHVRYSSRLIWVFAGAAFVWLGIMIGLTFNDYISRGWLAVPGV